MNRASLLPTVSRYFELDLTACRRLSDVITGTFDAVESVKAIMLGKYKLKDLGKIHLILGCEVLCDEAIGDYSMNQRHYVIDLCKKYLTLGGARVQTHMSEETLTKEMSPTKDQQKIEMAKIPYRQVVGSQLWLVTGSSVDIALAVTCVVLSTASILEWLIGTHCYEFSDT